MSAGLNVQQANFVKKLEKGYDQQDAAIAAGYSPRSAPAISSQLLKNPKIVKALERIGLTDQYLGRTLKKNIKAGAGISATADSSLRGIELAFKLKGYLDRAPEQNLTQNNIYVNELKTMDDSELNTKLDALLSDVEALKTK